MDLSTLAGADHTTDRRVAKSKSLIHDALIRILETKPIEKVTVKEIAEEAGINRKTFYTHYDTVTDVVNEIEDEIVANVEEFLQACMIDDYGLSPQYFMQFVNVIYASNEVFFDNLLIGTNYHFLIARCKESLKKQMLSGLDLPEEHKEKASYIIEFYLGGVSALFVDWFRNGKQVPFDTISELALDMIMDGIHGVGGIIPEKN